MAIIKAITQRNGRKVSLNSHYDQDRTPNVTMLTIGSHISLAGWNPAPEWGLYHGSMGVVVDIVFKNNESPNENHLPMYVMCEFPHYTGPIFDPCNPKHVPIAPIKAMCKLKCGCFREYVPLTVAFGKTIHTFQGMNVGPVNEGQEPNAIQHIIVDPGTRTFEGNSPGILYTLTSRATTMGNDNDKFSSAIYFSGPNMNEHRVQHITMSAKNQEYEKVKLRRLWTEHLNKNEFKNTMNEIDMEQMLLWGSTARFLDEEIQIFFEKHRQAK